MHKTREHLGEDTGCESSPQAESLNRSSQLPPTKLNHRSRRSAAFTDSAHLVIGPPEKRLRDNSPNPSNEAPSRMSVGGAYTQIETWLAVWLRTEKFNSITAPDSSQLYGGSSHAKYWSWITCVPHKCFSLRSFTSWSSHTHRTKVGTDELNSFIVSETDFGERIVRAKP